MLNKWRGKFCDPDKYVELEMGTESSYLGLWEKDLQEIISPKKRDEWNALRLRHCMETLTAKATEFFSFRLCSSTHKKQDRREPSFLKVDFSCCVNALKRAVALRERAKCTSSAARVWTNELQNTAAMGQFQKHRKVLDESLNVIPAIRVFLTFSHSVATYEQTMKGLSYFYPERIVEKNGIHTKPWQL